MATNVRGVWFEGRLLFAEDAAALNEKGEAVKVRKVVSRAIDRAGAAKLLGGVEGELTPACVVWRDPEPLESKGKR